jgi:ElaB/YqjD/DUF883 family membrane-anchored ribosome-binding protein
MSTSHTAPSSRNGERPLGKAEQALEAGAQAAGELMQTLQDGVADVRQQAPAAISRATAQVEDFARRGLQRARDAGSNVREQASRASDSTVGYIRDEPVKAVLIAAAAGAVLTVLAGALVRSRRD